MKGHILRSLIAVLALGIFGLPAEAQRRSRSYDRGGHRVQVNVRIGHGAVRFIKYDRGYYGPTARHRISLRRLARTSDRSFYRVVRDHRKLHRRMRHVNHHRADRMHRQWHGQQGWTHREFVEVERRQ